MNRLRDYEKIFNHFRHGGRVLGRMSFVVTNTIFSQLNSHISERHRITGDYYYQWNTLFFIFLTVINAKIPLCQLKLRHCRHKQKNFLRLENR